LETVFIEATYRIVSGILQCLLSKSVLLQKDNLLPSKLVNDYCSLYDYDCGGGVMVTLVTKMTMTIVITVAMMTMMVITMTMMTTTMTMMKNVTAISTAAAEML
jgi:hypothetical protein